MKTKHWIAGLVGMVVALALFAGNAQATDGDTDDDTTTTYKFRLVNNYNKSVEIRCGSYQSESGSWSSVGVGGSTDKTCSESDARTRVEGGGDLVITTHDCSSDNPVRKIEYAEHWVGLTLYWKVTESCTAS